tara:strand:- start:65 stop:391 length:327 start_codon:yes stop_codon:yes gene_type:complete
MRKLLLLLFLFALTSNALAEENKWALVVIQLNPSVISDEFLFVNKVTNLYNSKEQCETNVIKVQEKNGGTITRDTYNHIQLEIDVSPDRESNTPQLNIIMVCTETVQK